MLLPGRLLGSAPWNLWGPRFSDWLGGNLHSSLARGDWFSSGNDVRTRINIWEGSRDPANTACLRAFSSQPL